jgi:hypothetical protein
MGKGKGKRGTAEWEGGRGRTYVYSFLSLGLDVAPGYPLPHVFEDLGAGAAVYEDAVFGHC